MSQYLVLDRTTFYASYLERYQSIFAWPPMPLQPFVNEQWSGLLFPGSFMTAPNVYDALRRASTSIGDSEFVLTAIYGEDGFETSVAGRWPNTLAEFLEARKAAQLDHTPASELFGASTSKWGCCFFFDEYFQIAGEQEFIDMLAEALGGQETLRTNFYRFAAHGWPIGAGDRDAILNRVGW
jgi:hypothetical protein